VYDPSESNIEFLTNNQSFQPVFRIRIELNTDPDSGEPFQYGSTWIRDPYPKHCFPQILLFFHDKPEAFTNLKHKNEKG